MTRRYVFGQPVRAVKAVDRGPRPLFVLGAYPSALHVQWSGPDGRRLIRAVAVDDEPEAFWNGDDQDARLVRWKDSVGFRHEWGCVQPCGALNGSSGAWLDEQILDPLVGADRERAWVTDCLDTYHESTAAARRMDSEPIANLVATLGIPGRIHDRHPSESDIVKRAVATHRERLVEELSAARPDVVVTLGNAALRVFATLVKDLPDPPGRLSTETYGRPLSVLVQERRVTWLPFAHPAAPLRYQEAHARWKDQGPGSGRP